MHVGGGQEGDQRGRGAPCPLTPALAPTPSGATRTQAQPTAIGAPEPLRVAEGPDCRTAVCVQGTTPLGMPRLSPRGPWPPGGRGPHPQAGLPPGSPVRDVRGSGELCKPPWQHMKPLAGGEAAAAGTVFGRAACSGPSAVNIYSSPGATCSPCSHREPTPHCPAARGGQLAGDRSHRTAHRGSSHHWGAGSQQGHCPQGTRLRGWCHLCRHLGAQATVQQGPGWAWCAGHRAGSVLGAPSPLPPPPLPPSPSSLRWTAPPQRGWALYVAGLGSPPGLGRRGRLASVLGKRSRHTRRGDGEQPGQPGEGGPGSGVRMDSAHRTPAAGASLG